MINFFVPGTPAPGGSKRPIKHKHTGKVVVIDDAKGNKAWRDRVAAFAFEHYTSEPLKGPLSLRLMFIVTRPKGHYRTGRNSHALRDSAPKWPTVKPDVTKLVRALEDALKGITWEDDSQVVTQWATKVYGSRPGCYVTIQPLGELEPIALPELPECVGAAG